MQEDLEGTGILENVEVYKNNMMDLPGPTKDQPPVVKEFENDLNITDLALNEKHLNSTDVPANAVNQNSTAEPENAEL